MRTLRVCFALLAWCACDAPPVFATADKPQQVVTGLIQGQVVAEGLTRGNVTLLLFESARLPPPYGTGKPLSFSTVSSEALFGTATDNGPFTAPFSFSTVTPGDYFIEGLIDANADFNPFYTVTAGANAGDVVGASVDPTTLAPRDISARFVASDVGVSFSDASRVPVDRPAFQIPGGAPTAVISTTLPTIVQLAPQPLDVDVIHEPNPVFLVQLIDANHDGLPDDANHDGLPDVWPEVVVRELAGLNPLTDENDADGDGVPDDPTKPLTVIAAVVDPTAYMSQLLDAAGHVKTTPTVVTALTVVVDPLALDVTNPLAPKPLPTMPTGNYSITLIESTGQTWRVPNELDPPTAGQLNLPPVVSQAFILQVP
jgi:hypothetical protein